MATPTRDTILRTLRARGRCTVNELATAAEVSPVSVRHHLANLQAEGMIGVEEVKHGVGRPRHQFFLTDAGHDLAPGRYYRLANRLLDEIKVSLPEDQVQSLFHGVASSMADDYAVQLAGLPLEMRLSRLVNLLSEEGFDASLEDSDDKVIIRELSCPYYRIGLQHPEVCDVDQSFIASALDLPVERVSCLLGGDTHCTFAVTKDPEMKELPADDRPAG
jgi:DeoR family transcriptional regulator, suf operon transcriptional repressor